MALEEAGFLLFFVVATHALIVPSPPLISPLELRRERTDGSITGHLNSALAEIFIAFDRISRAFLGRAAEVESPINSPLLTRQPVSIHTSYIRYIDGSAYASRLFYFPLTST